MSRTTHLACESCWIKREPLLTPARDQEMIGTHKVWQPCCFCGTLTASGIFVREDPANAKCGGEGAVHAGDEAEAVSA